MGLPDSFRSRVARWRSQPCQVGQVVGVTHELAIQFGCVTDCQHDDFDPQTSKMNCVRRVHAKGENHPPSFVRVSDDSTVGLHRHSAREQLLRRIGNLLDPLRRIAAAADVKEMVVFKPQF